MTYFLSEAKIEAGQSFFIRGSELRHMRLSRKIRTGEKVEVQDPSYQRFLCLVEEVRSSFLKLQPLNLVEEPETSIKPILKLFVPPLKEKAWELILQKATELDVFSINLFQSTYSKRLPPGSVLANKLSRWFKITKEACKQSGRRYEPDLNHFLSLEQALERLQAEKVKSYILDPHGSELHLALDANKIKEKQSYALFIGPEGGFTADELNNLSAERVRLPFSVLRAETACLAGLAIFQFCLNAQPDKGSPL